ncbi:Uncharacterised protein [Bordetella pertussis]|nr:Uncharacterised protein [Bordetella pertussis]
MASSPPRRSPMRCRMTAAPPLRPGRANWARGCPTACCPAARSSRWTRRARAARGCCAPVRCASSRCAPPPAAASARSPTRRRWTRRWPNRMLARCAAMAWCWRNTWKTSRPTASAWRRWASIWPAISARSR